MKKEHTVRYTLDNLPAGRIDRPRVLGMSEEEIERTALSDPDNPPATEEELAEGELVFPTDRKKISTCIRFDPEVVEFFKREGAGYQTRINAVLLRYVRKQKLTAEHSYPAGRTRGGSPQRVRFTPRSTRFHTRTPRPFQAHGD